MSGRSGCAMATERSITGGYFFQAGDGIRDYKVTGVQTCALPISWTLRTNIAHYQYGGMTEANHTCKRPRPLMVGDTVSVQRVAEPSKDVIVQAPCGCKLRSEEHTSELQSPCNLVCRLLLEKNKERQRNQTEDTNNSHTLTYRIAGNV